MIRSRFGGRRGGIMAYAILSLPPSGADSLVRGRPPGRPSCGRPAILTRFLYQTRPNRVLLNVVTDCLELALITNNAIIALFLPEAHAGASQQLVRPFGCDSFQ